MVIVSGFCVRARIFSGAIVLLDGADAFAAVLDFTAGCVWVEHVCKSGDNPCSLIQHATTPWLHPQMYPDDAPVGIGPIRNIRVGEAEIDCSDCSVLEYIARDPTSNSDAWLALNIGYARHRCALRLSAQT